MHPHVMFTSDWGLLFMLPFSLILPRILCLGLCLRRSPEFDSSVFCCGSQIWVILILYRFQLHSYYIVYLGISSGLGWLLPALCFQVAVISQHRNYNF
jgi:hypothetical protein